MKRVNRLYAIGVLLSAVSLAGCYEEPQVTLYEPGVYKGERDPLLALQQSPDQQERLRQRFDLIQTDR